MDVYQIITERILGELERGTVPWKKPWNCTDGPQNLVSHKAYRGLNRLLLADSPYWITFKQALELGGHVKPGAKSAIAIFWKTYEPNYSRNVRDEENATEEILKTRFVLRYYNVFRLADCELPEDKLPKPDAERPKLDPILEAERIIAGYQNGPEIILTPSNSAAYSPLRDQIVAPLLSQYQNADLYYCTLFHEIIHSTGHKDRLNRFGEGNSQFGSESYSKEELIAEIGSAFLCGASGIKNTIEHSSSYIDHWRKKLGEDKRLIITASSAAQAAADRVIAPIEVQK